MTVFQKIDSYSARRRLCAEGRSMKRRLTIQMKVTLWFTLLMVLLACVSLAFLFYVGGRTAQEETRRQMTAMVQAAWREIDFDDGKLRFLYKGIIIKHNKPEPTYTKTSLFLCEKRRFFMARTEKGVVATI